MQTACCEGFGCSHINSVIFQGGDRLPRRSFVQTVSCKGFGYPVQGGNRLSRRNFVQTASCEGFGCSHINNVIFQGAIEFPEGPFLVKDLVTPFKGAIDFPEGTLCRPLLVNQQLSCTAVCSSSTVLVERCLKDARKTL